jgi:hypothetical protein
MKMDVLISYLNMLPAGAITQALAAKPMRNDTYLHIHTYSYSYGPDEYGAECLVEIVLDNNNVRRYNVSARTSSRHTYCLRSRRADMEICLSGDFSGRIFWRSMIDAMVEHLPDIREIRIENAIPDDAYYSRIFEIANNLQYLESKGTVRR